MLVLITLLEAVPTVVKYEKMGVPGSALCLRRCRNIWAADDTGLPFSSPVTSMVVESPLTLFFCVYRNRVTSQARRNTSTGSL